MRMVAEDGLNERRPSLHICVVDGGSLGEQKVDHRQRPCDTSSVKGSGAVGHGMVNIDPVLEEKLDDRELVAVGRNGEGRATALVDKREAVSLLEVLLED